MQSEPPALGWELDDKDKQKELKFKKSDFKKGDYIDLKRFTNKFEKTNLKDPKTGQYIERDVGNNPHGGSYWKLFTRDKERIGTLSKEGKFLRE